MSTIAAGIVTFAGSGPLVPLCYQWLRLSSTRATYREEGGEREAEIEGRGTIIRSATIWVAEPSSFERSQFGNESLLAFSRWPALYRPVSTKLFFGRPSSGKRRRLRRNVRIMFDLHLEFGRIGL